MNASRRCFLTGLGAIIAAPAIIRVADLMPIKPVAAGESLTIGGGASFTSFGNGMRVGDMIRIAGCGVLRTYKIKALSAGIITLDDGSKIV